MNRNALVGAGLAALVLATLAVGISTFVSGQGIDQSAEEIRTEIAQETKASVDALASMAVMAEGGSATGLTATDLTSATKLRAEGLLAVMPDSESEDALFMVGSLDGGPNEAVIAVPLTVTGPTELADLTADQLRATVVSGDTLQTASGSFAAAENGNVKADGDLTVGGNAAVGKDLLISGAKFAAGTVKNGITPLVFESSFVPGKLPANPTSTDKQLDSLRSRPVLTVLGGIITNTLVVQPGEGAGGLVVGGNITATGAINAGSANVLGNLRADSIDTIAALRARSLEINTGTFKVDEWGNVYAANANMSGLVSAGSLESGPATITGDLTVTGDVNFNSAKTRGKDFIARDLVATRSIMVEGGGFTVDVSGNVSGGDITGGALTVNSATISGASTLTGDVTAGNDVDVTNDLRVGNDVFVTRNLEVTGNIVYSGTLGTSTKNLTVKAITGETATFDTVNAGVLNAATSLAVASNKFTVDTSGNGAFAGNLAVAGNLTVAGNAAVSGDLGVTGTVSASSISAGNLKSGTTGPVASTDTVSVSGMPSSASVTVTPLEAVGGDFWVQIGSGAFTIHHTGGATPAFSWIATW